MNLSRYIHISKDEGKGIINKYLSIVEGGEDLSVKELVRKGKEVIEDYKNQTKKARFFSEIKGYHYKSVNTFTVGEWIDFEKFLQAKDIARALTVIYRKKETSDLYKDVWEEWGGYSGKRSNLFLDVDAWKIIGGLERAKKERLSILKSHEGIFETNSFDYENEEKHAESEEAKRVLKEEKKKDEIRNSYNMELLILDVAGGDFTKIESVLKMNINTLFHFIAVSKLKEKL